MIYNIFYSDFTQQKSEKEFKVFNEHFSKIESVSCQHISTKALIQKKKSVFFSHPLNTPLAHHPFIITTMHSFVLIHLRMCLPKMHSISRNVIFAPYWKVHTIENVKERGKKWVIKVESSLEFVSVPY